MARAPNKPMAPIVKYELLQPIFLIKRIVIEDNAIPTKLALESTALAVLLLSAGKKSATKLKAKGLIALDIVPCKNLRPARTQKYLVKPVVI